MQMVNDKLKENVEDRFVMYEELYQSIPNLDAYFERIHVEKEENFTEEYLDKLVFAHQCEVPFENLDVRRKEPILLDTEALFDKVITKKRGGYCFELNGLFSRFLKDVGFKVFPCRCRITRGKDFLPPVLHRGSIVELEDGLYYCDVGFGGPQPGGCIKVEDGYEKFVADQKYRITKHDEHWWDLSRELEEGWESVMQFTLVPQPEQDYIALSMYCALHPASVFVQKTLLNRRLVNGSVALTDELYVKNVGGVRTEEVITDKKRYAEVIETEFGIPNTEALLDF